MLKEARIVMPTLPGQPEASGNAHNALRRALTEAFGGLTAVDGGGHWINPSKWLVIDRVVVYDVAIEADRDASWDKLFQIAMTAGRALGQESVYIRYPDGSVEIASCAIKLTHSKDNPRVAASFGDVSGAEAEAYKPTAPLGAKRLPQVGEVWRNSIGQLVAVAKTFTKIDNGYKCITLTLGDSGATHVGYHYEVYLDGKVLPDKSSHPRDLKTFVTRFDS